VLQKTQFCGISTLASAADWWLFPKATGPDTGDATFSSVEDSPSDTANQNFTLYVLP
jgi:hypothetical protein